MLTGKGKIALAGLAAVAAVAMAGSSKKDAKASPKGETWHYVFAIHPDVPSDAAFQELAATFKYLTTDGQITDIDYPERNTVDVTIHYPGKPHMIPEVNSVMTVGPYSLTLTEKDRVS
jgi:hypothetical protein